MESEQMVAKVVARKSGLHGMGLFAARDLGAGERLIEYKGKRYAKGEAPNLGEDGVTKFLGLSDGSGIDGTGWAALANHGCNPNCELVEDDSGNLLRAWLVTLRKVAKGEELVWDYRLEVKSRKAAYTDWTCACSAEDCRGTMADPKGFRDRAAKAGGRKSDLGNDRRSRKS